MRRASAGFVFMLIPISLSGCGGVDNATPERAARCMLAAMIRADSKTITALNKSEPTGWPTSRILEEANHWKVVGSDSSDYRFKETADNEYELVNEKCGVTVYMKLILADGRYYAIRCGAKGNEAGLKTALARRERCLASEKNLILIGLGIHNYARANKTFPPAYAADRNGKPLLSWRVLILKYMNGNDDLYRQFHLDEPWDSERNRKLLSRMPAVYKTPGSTVADHWQTNYLTVRGEDTIFSGKTPTTYAMVRNGLSNTIMTVEVSDARAVEWTRPDDFEYNPQNPIEGLGGVLRSGFLAGMCDGSVRFYRSPRGADVFKSLFNMRNHAVVNAEGDTHSVDDFR